MNAYESKQEARRARLEARAERLRGEANSTFNRAKELASAIPFGQPILVGHYSEKRDRNYRKKIGATYDKAFALNDAAGAAAARAASVGTGGISSDDPDAIKKLEAELAALKDRQAAMKAKNDAWRKAGNKAGRQADGTWIDPPCAPYQLTNNGANIRRIEQRIESLRKAAERETSEKTVDGGVRIVQNAEANRLQIFFPGKPAPDVIKDLKGRGFRWAPSEGAWQRHLSNAAIWAADCIVKAATGAE